MSNNISRRDMEVLSAYLDGELKGAERDKLELRLQSDPELNASLNELRNMKSLLRSSPQASPPRHFTLSEDMLAETSRSFWGSAFSLNLVSAVASVLLVVVLIGDIGGFAASRELTSLSAPAEAFADSEESTGVISPASGEAIKPQADEPDQELADDALADLQTEDAEANAAARSEDSEEDADLAAEAVSEPAADGVDQAAAEEGAAAESESSQDEFSEDAVGEVFQEPTASPLAPIAESAAEPNEKVQETRSDVQPILLLRVIEILLAAIALAFALFARRRRAI